MKENEIEITSYCVEGNLKLLKEWAEDMGLQGYKSFRYDIEYCPLYNGIESISLIATK